MSKKVGTPTGVKEVLTEEEFNHRNQNRDMTGYEEKKGTWYCKECGTIILSKKIPHPVWDGPFAYSGSGRCINEEVPYCPGCEKVPNFEGEPITPKGSYHNP